MFKMDIRFIGFEMKMFGLFLGPHNDMESYGGFILKQSFLTVLSFVTSIYIQQMVLVLKMGGSEWLYRDFPQ